MQTVAMLSGAEAISNKAIVFIRTDMNLRIQRASTATYALTTTCILLFSSDSRRQPAAD